MHPLEPLSRSELQDVVRLLRTAGHVHNRTRIAYVALREPQKQLVYSWDGSQGFPRLANVTLFDNDKNLCSKGTVDLRSGSVVLSEVPDVQPLITVDELEECEQAVLNNESFRRKILEHYPDDPRASMDNLICDVWSAGYYGEQADEGLRLARPMFFFKDEDTDNPFAYPIEGLRPVVDLNRMEVIRIEDHGVWPLPPPYFNGYRQDKMLDAFRTDLKPLEIVQRNGPSFQVDGNQVSWQKWSFVVGFNGKEGLTLHDIRYDDRPILYRAAISDMIVPYGDPSPQQARKNAFDVSEYGIGFSANSLKLGCDCLGVIRYFDAEMLTSRGLPFTVENAVCMHEEDYGVLWKHFDRHSGSTEVRRSRRLVVSMFSTVENYDYGFFWYFYQDGNIQVEVKLTGFLSLGARFPDDPYPKHGNLVAPQVYAPNHQHWFNFRLDFAVDGVENTVVQVDAVPDPPGEDNPFHNAFHARETVFESEEDAKSNVCLETSRSWNICNESKKNALGRAVAYKLVPGTNIRPLADPDSWWRRRARFVDHHVWVTPCNEDEFCCTGEFPNQCPEDRGLPVWTLQNRPLRNKDCVLWYSFGVTHVPRPEDFPVMPAEYCGFLLKPFGFFDCSPAWDVPPQELVNGERKKCGSESGDH